MRSGVFSRLRSVVVSAAVVSLALAGCSASGGGASSSTSAEVFETSTTTALPPLEYEAPPQYPEDLEVDSPANAETFVGFVIDTFNYAQRFNDVGVVDAISTEGCVFCQSFTELLSSFQSSGSRRIGGDLSCTVTSIEYQPETEIFYLHSDCLQTQGFTYGPEGQLLGSVEPAEPQFTWAVTMLDGVWKLVDAGTTAPQGGS